MRGSSNVRKYLEAIIRNGKDVEVSGDYKQGVVDTLEWMLGNKDERPITLAKKEKKAAAAKPKRVRAPRKRPSKAPRAFPKEQQVQPSP